MSYRIIPTKEFIKDFKKLDNSVQERIKKKIEEVAENPERYEHMHYDFTGSCRIRIEKLRVIFSYNIKKQELYLEQIIFGHKYRD
ncbi:MAG: type II toxin-antitoxin system RelE/ParE family toxin [Candidatus Pacearchaeota archaeon]